MTTFYSVIQRIYDDGKTITTKGSVEAESKPANVSRETARYDYYANYFDTKAERDEFYAEIKECE